MNDFYGFVNDLRRRTVRRTPERRQMKTDLHKNSGRLLASGPPSLDGCALPGLHSQPLMPDQFVRHLRGILTAGRLCTKNTSWALIGRPYSCAPQAVGA